MFLLFFLLWIVLCGKVTVEIAVLGVAIAAALLAFMCKFMDYSLRKERNLLCIAPLLAQYLFVLLWEIVKANVATARLITNQKVEVEPQFIRFRTDLTTNLAKAILANSITLTPGTITVTLSGNEYLVHCLDVDLAGDLVNSVFVRKLKHIESKLT